MAAIVALISWWSRWFRALLTAGAGWLTLNGFVTDRYGELCWHGDADLMRPLVLYAVAITVLVAHIAELAVRGRVATQPSRRQDGGELTKLSSGDPHA